MGPEPRAAVAGDRRHSLPRPTVLCPSGAGKLLRVRLSVSPKIWDTTSQWTGIEASPLWPVLVLLFQHSSLELL